MMTVRSIGNPKYSASEVIREIAMNRRLRQGAIVGSGPQLTSTR